MADPLSHFPPNTRAANKFAADSLSGAAKVTHKAKESAPGLERRSPDRHRGAPRRARRNPNHPRTAEARSPVGLEPQLRQSLDPGHGLRRQSRAVVLDVEIQRLYPVSGLPLTAPSPRACCRNGLPVYTDPVSSRTPASPTSQSVSDSMEQMCAGIFCTWRSHKGLSGTASP